MRLSRALWASLAVCVVALVALQLIAEAAPSAPEEKDEGQHQGARVPGLFDFEQYKRLFNKNYSGGFTEAMVRLKMFMSRAIRVSISAVKFRFRQDHYHLSLNEMSDQTPAELDLMRNKVMEEEFAGAAESELQDDPLPEYIPRDDEDVLAELRQAIEANKGKPGFEALREELEQVISARNATLGARRRKREASLAPLPPRPLPLDKLINAPPTGDPDAALPAETRAKINLRPRSNNPEYEPMELESQGLMDQQTKLRPLYLAPRPSFGDLPDLVGALGKSLNGLRMKYMANIEFPGQPHLAAANQPQEQVEKPDEVFLDLRTTSNCLFAPRSQGSCGSCYAFAVTTVAEWLLCKATGQLTPLSEQYMVDCGKQFTAGDSIDGCHGGHLSYVNNFFHNFGWELRASYPYVAREQQCPYEADTDLRKVGYIRADMRRNIEIEMARWPEALEKFGPLAIQINTGPAFREYGSGVYDSCVPRKPKHGVVLIGHGREDGQEYWLIRNSHSAGWGEGGHMKLSKKADCVYPRTGFTFGSDNGEQLVLRPQKNALNDGQALKKSQEQRILDSLKG